MHSYNRLRKTGPLVYILWKGSANISRVGNEIQRVIERLKSRIIVFEYERDTSKSSFDNSLVSQNSAAVFSPGPCRGWD